MAHEPVPYPFAAEPGPGLAPAYAAAMASPGLVRVRMPHGEPAWLATRYDDVRLVMGDSRFSRAAAVERDYPRLTQYKLSGMLSADPPEHTWLRAPAAKAFTRHRVERLRGWVRGLAESLVDKMKAAGPPADLMRDFAMPLPVVVICELLGVPEADRDRFGGWSAGMMPTAPLTIEERMRIGAELREYFAALVGERRAEPRDDLVSALVRERDAQDRPSEEELLDLCGGLLIAGHETTTAELGNFAHVLLSRPELVARLRAEPNLIGSAVEELLRFVPLSAGGSFPNYAKEDVEVGGVLVRAGEPVLVSVGAANRDATRFANPDEVVLDREDNRHLGFGHGVHFCPGAQLARLELQEALAVLLTRIPGLHLVDEATWTTGSLVHGPLRLPVGW